MNILCGSVCVYVCAQVLYVLYQGMHEAWKGDCVLYMTSRGDQYRNAVHAGIGLPHTQTLTTQHSGTSVLSRR